MFNGGGGVDLEGLGEKCGKIAQIGMRDEVEPGMRKSLGNGFRQHDLEGRGSSAGLGDPRGLKAQLEQIFRSPDLKVLQNSIEGNWDRRTKKPC